MMLNDDFPIKDGQTVVFMGDSITDCGRRNPENAAPYGKGYMEAVMGLVTARWPQRRIAWHNRGISGEVAEQLLARVEPDVVDLKPTWVSFLVGINDLLRKYDEDGSELMPPQRYRKAYDQMLARTVQAGAERLVMMDPFYMTANPPAGSKDQDVLSRIGEYIGVVEELAAKYGAIHIPLHRVFQDHLAYRPASLFCPEPVHPNRFGHMIIAGEWLKAVEAAR